MWPMAELPTQSACILSMALISVLQIPRTPPVGCKMGSALRFYSALRDSIMRGLIHCSRNRLPGKERKYDLHCLQKHKLEILEN